MLTLNNGTMDEILTRRHEKALPNFEGWRHDCIRSCCIVQGVLSKRLLQDAISDYCRYFEVNIETLDTVLYTKRNSLNKRGK